MEGSRRSRLVSWSQLITMICLSSILRTAQGNICQLSQVTQQLGDKVFVYLTLPDGDGCECDITIKNTTETASVKFEIQKFMVTEEDEERCVPYLHMAYDSSLSDSDEAIYFMCAASSDYPNYIMAMTSNSRARVTLYNPDPPRRIEGDFYVQQVDGSGHMSVVCKEATPAYSYTTCPCLEHTNGTGGYIPPAAVGDNSSRNKKLTAGFVSAAVFLIIVALIVIAWYYWKKRREEQDTEKQQPGLDGAGAENRAYHASKTSLPESQQKNKFTPDPDLNLNLASTPSGSMGNNMDPAGSRDSGWNSMQQQPGRGPHYDHYNNHPQYPPRPMRPEELEANFAKPHRRADSPPPDTFPRSARSQEQLNNDYVTAELRAPSSVHDMSEPSVETEI